MSEKVLQKFEVKRLEILDENGNADSKLMPELSNEQIISMYEAMVLTRKADEKALSLQRQGRLGTLAVSFGQEATVIGSAASLKKDDWMTVSFREEGAMLYRGIPLENIFYYWGGDERGNTAPKGVNNLPVAVPVGTQTLHAVGIGMAANIKGKKIASMVYFGDGGTSEGDFHEAMNWAGVFNAPVVFVCQNNQWAISTPREKQSKSLTLAQKSFAYGFNGIQVDGNDVFAVYKACSEAVQKARKGEGPALIECETYRMADHTTSDDAKKYRTEKELMKWKAKDPIERLRKYMEKEKIWNQEKQKKLEKELDEMISKAVKKFEDTPAQEINAIFKFMYAKMTPRLEEQLSYAKEVAEEIKKEEKK
ncbi:MAG TPA: pyruvate dehydrogenase (acetyl-transferring) E1 component subunit alpha [archaeon]|nr:pyruvate dehydrogenase (acetyl-transferring) E1 component subunit alpha [archaeon]